MDEVNEQGYALLTLIFGAFFVLPIYMVLLLIGLVLRPRLVIRPFAKWMFLLSLPVTISLYLSVAFFGSDDYRFESTLGHAVAFLAPASLGAGVLAVAIIIAQSLAGKRPRQNR